MTRYYLPIIAFVAVVANSTAGAEIYSWPDEQGTLHFTEDLGKVPQKFRNKARGADETEPVMEEKATSAPSAKASETLPQAVVAPAGDVDDGSYAGKTYDQWQKELAERETAMTAVRKRIDELAEQAKAPAISWDEQKKLLLEHKSLRAQFKEMKAEYFKQVEIARKAGLTVNIEQ